MSPKKRGSIAILSAILALGGATSTLASTHSHAVAKQSYSCAIAPNQQKCKSGTGGTRVTGGAGGSAVGGTRSKAGAGGSAVSGTRSKGGTSGKRTGNARGNGRSGAGANGAGKSGAGANGAGANGAGANGSSPVPGQSLPVTGYGGTAQDLGASPRTAAAGTQPVVVGLASSPSLQRVTALPATGGGVPSQPASPLLALIACGLAVLGLGLRKVAGRF
jgi:hypothetical protein